MARSRSFPRERAEALAGRIAIGLEIPICTACLSFVSMALDAGDPAEVSRQTRHMTPILWYDGLAEPALAAVREARERDVPHARAALADLEARGGRSVVARAIVLRLAAELSTRVHAELQVIRAARERLSLAPPELN
jgi:hypothetical protein